MSEKPVNPYISSEYAQRALEDCLKHAQQRVSELQTANDFLIKRVVALEDLLEDARNTLASKGIPFEHLS